MRRHTIILAAAIACGSFSLAESAMAQAFYQPIFPSGGRGYQAYRPTTSPYLNLLRADAGLAPNYQTLVRPQMQQLGFNQMQRYNVGRLEQVTQELTTRSSRRGDASDLARPTGHISRFFDTSHYFGGAPMTGPSPTAFSGMGGR